MDIQKHAAFFFLCPEAPKRTKTALNYSQSCKQQSAPVHNSVIEAFSELMSHLSSSFISLCAGMILTCF